MKQKEPILTHTYGYVKQERVFLKSFLDYPDRQIGVVKESPEASFLYFEKRFEIAKQKVFTLEKLIEKAQNKGSYLMKLIHMRKYLSNFDGLGNFITLFDKLDEMELSLKELIANNRIKNFEIKKALLEDLKNLIDGVEEEWQEATEKVQELKMKWIKTGAALDEFQQGLEDEFNEVLESFYEKRKEHFKQKSEKLKNNINGYKLLINKAYEYKDSDDFDEAFKQFRVLQKTWKEGEKIPHRKAVELWSKFKDLNDQFFARFKNFKNLQEEYPDLPSSEIKDTLLDDFCKRAKALTEINPSIAVEKAKKLLMEWKKFSMTFRQLDRDKASKFRNYCDKVFEMNYLMRVIKRKYPLFDSKLQEEKLRIKVSFMKELHRRDEQEMKLTEQNFYKINGQKKIYYGKAREQYSQLKVQRRKMYVKKQILRELEENLLEYKK